MVLNSFQDLHPREFLPGGIRIHPHVRLTPEVFSLNGEELSIFQTENYRKQAADWLLKLLMLSRINKIPLTIVDRFKWDLSGSSSRLCGNVGFEVFGLFSTMVGEGGFEKGMAIAFPLHFSRGFEMDKKIKKWVDEWQKLVYISPYENASHLPPKSDESNKWAVGLLHELFHLFVPKKTDKENILCWGVYRSSVEEESSQYPCHSSVADERSKSFGHVEFATLEAAQKALNMNDRDLLGYAVRLDLPCERGHAYFM
ncbi:unnamed protein product, partial [Vitis vinifera]